ncbi:MAG TPA: TonB family protein [Nitrospira sp.]|nr:TonB family protein [Nitrospira sp.]
MTVTSERRLFLQAWSLSAVFHGLVVAGALMFMAQMKPLPVKDVFQWEVALVQPVAENTQQEQTEPVHPASAATPASPVRPVEPVSDPTPQIVTEARTVEQPAVVRRETPQITERPRPTEQPRPIQQQERTVIEKQTPKQVQAAERAAEPVLEQVTERQPAMAEQSQSVTGAAPVTRSEPVETASAAQHTPATSPVSTAAPVEAPSAVQHLTAPPPVSHTKPVEMASAVQSLREEPVIRHEAVSAPSRETVVESPPSTAVEVPKSVEQPMSAAAPPSSPAIMESHSAVAKAASQSSTTKADHRWLAESLWRRVAELKRYPSAARLNGLEGKVVLKAIIRSDGHLAEVSVQKSSGHSVLDEAAMEAVKLACPLHMKHELGTPQIVVSLPIVYSLAN